MKIYLFLSLMAFSSMEIKSAQDAIKIHVINETGGPMALYEQAHLVDEKRVAIVSDLTGCDITLASGSAFRVVHKQGDFLLERKQNRLAARDRSYPPMANLPRNFCLRALSENQDLVIGQSKIDLRSQDLRDCIYVAHEEEPDVSFVQFLMQYGAYFMKAMVSGQIP